MKKQIIGTVVSTLMQKTITIKVERKFRHPLYQKVVTKHKKFKVHNEIEDIKLGDKVLVEQTRPISKEVHFQTIKKVDQTVQ